jgi:hypothetical protein
LENIEMTFGPWGSLEADLSVATITPTGGTSQNLADLCAEIGQGSSGVIPRTAFPAAISGIVTLAYPSSGSIAYYGTIAANTVFVLSGGSTTQRQTIYLEVYENSTGGFSIGLPSVTWTNGSAPAPVTTANAFNGYAFSTTWVNGSYTGTPAAGGSATANAVQTFPSNGSIPFLVSGSQVYESVITAPVTVTLAAGSTTYAPEIILNIRQNSVGGNVITLPTNASTPPVFWPGGIAPSLGTAANAVNSYRFRWSPTFSAYVGSY